MNRRIYLVAFLFIFFSAHSQTRHNTSKDNLLRPKTNAFQNYVTADSIDHSDICPLISGWKGKIGGIILPSTGILNVILIFSQFPDDNYCTGNLQWSKGKEPIDKDEWISKTWTDNPPQGSLTHYFNEMSFNKFKFIGKTVSVTAPHTRQWYLDNGWKRGNIQKEIILQINKTMNFAEFDNWHWIADHNQLNEPDKKIDFIIFIWRNIAKELPDEENIKHKLDFSNDITNLGGFQSPYDTTDYVLDVDGGLRKVFMLHAGITVRNYLPERNLAFRITVHEIAHYLLGDMNYHNGFGFWGMLSSYGVKSIVANSFERSRLGWIKLKTIPSSSTQTIYNVKLSDYVTTGDAYCLEIDSASGQCFYLENHQNISYWETKFKLGNIEKGLYLIHKDNLTPSNKKDNPSSCYMRLIPADGRFDWTVNQIVDNPWGSALSFLPVFKKLKPDRVNGYYDLDYITWNWNGLPQKALPIYFTEDQGGKPQLDVRYQGDGNDAFRIGYNEVFSLWSNPNSNKADRTPTPFGFKIDSLVNGVYSMDIYVNNSIEAPPSKPIGLNAIIDSISNAVKLVWQCNMEPDFYSYEIFRKIRDEWKLIGTTQDTSFIDNSINLSSIKGDENYKIRAKDTQDQYSIYSDIKPLRLLSSHEITGVNNLIIQNEYKLYQNYPNPFNPTTIIKYSITSSQFVTLKIFNVLGQEIETLVNEEKPAGNYKVEFTTDSLPSGVYLYRMTAGTHKAVRKIVLLK